MSRRYLRCQPDGEYPEHVPAIEDDAWGDPLPVRDADRIVDLDDAEERDR